MEIDTKILIIEVEKKSESWASESEIKKGRNKNRAAKI